jgi:hypothetical protein
MQVVAEFSRLSARLSLLPIGAAGAAAALAAHRMSAPGIRPLELFFPFDPYLLHRSARLLELEVGSHGALRLKSAICSKVAHSMGRQCCSHAHAQLVHKSAVQCLVASEKETS